MEIVRKIDRAQAQKILDGSLSLKASKDNPIFFSSRNAFAMENRDLIQSMDKHKQETNDENDSVLLVIDDLNPNLDLFWQFQECKWIHGKLSVPVLQSELTAKDILRIEEINAKHRMNILMNTSMYDEKWCYPALKKVYRPTDRVCILAFSFYDDTKNAQDWDRQFGAGRGIWYRANTDPFLKFGLKKDQIVWVNFFEDSPEVMKNKILNSSILVLPGGAPDLMMKRIKEKKLTAILKNYQQTIVGFSAGAMIQLKRYHITPDEDYPDYGWYSGLGYLDDFDIEVHYQGSSHQKRHIEKAMDDSGLEVIAIYEKGGMICEPKGKRSYFGQIDFFSLPEQK